MVTLIIRYQGTCHPVVAAQDTWSLDSALAVCRTGSEWQALTGSEAQERDDVVAVFVAARRDVCLLVTSPPCDALVNGKHLVRGRLHELRSGDRVMLNGFGEFTLEVSESASRGVWEGTGDTQLRCPVCKAAFRIAEPIASCGRCHATHHLGCFLARRKRCGVYGCVTVTQFAAKET